MPFFFACKNKTKQQEGNYEKGKFSKHGEIFYKWSNLVTKSKLKKYRIYHWWLGHSAKWSGLPGHISNCLRGCQPFLELFLFSGSFRKVGSPEGCDEMHPNAGISVRYTIKMYF